MKAMLIDSRRWTDEMHINAVRKLEKLGYKEYSPSNTGIMGLLTLKRIITFSSTGEYYLDYLGSCILYSKRTIHTYAELMAMTKEDVK
jgi:hypothetical protein